MEQQSTQRAWKWVTPKAVAADLVLSAYTIREWLRSGRVPEHCFVRTAKGYLIRSDFVENPVLLKIAPRPSRRVAMRSNPITSIAMHGDMEVDG